MKGKVLNVVSVLFGLMFINGGLNKLFQYIPVPEDMPENMVNLMAAMNEFIWLMPLVAVVEILGGFLFFFNKTRALAAVIIFPIVIGILLTHLINEPSGLPVALVLLAINIWVIIENLEKYKPMIR